LKRLQNQARRCAAFSVLWRNTRLTAIWLRGWFSKCCRTIALFGYKTIDCLPADREFVGEQWINRINHSKTRYYIRIREIFWV
jgi:hypothetical protein